MRLPDLSNAVGVALMRHIQSIHEAPDLRNPDTLIRHLLPIRQRLRAAWLGRKELSKLRANPFYYYLVARTKYYDRVVVDAVSSGVQQIVNVGCGGDTRAYRLMHLLRGNGVKVLECDQPEVIQAKQRLLQRWHYIDHVEYSPIDLNEDGWPQLEQWLRHDTPPKVLVLMEGVSPYIHESCFRRFLLFLATVLPAGSHVVYDFKICGVNDDFGRNRRTRRPFRLSREIDGVATFHEAIGLQLEHMELSSQLCARSLPGLEDSAFPPFAEDGLLQLRVDRAKSRGDSGAADARTFVLTHTRGQI